MKRLALLALLLAVLCPARALDQPIVKQNDRVAVVGDSITEQKIYCRFIEDYLLACQPQLNTVSMQYGWSGEWARGFLGRMDNDLKGFSPTVVTLCYGMNDGSYRAFTPDIGKVYQDAMRGIVEKLKKAGATVVVGSPGAVDSQSYHKDPAAAVVYNDNLRQLGDLAQQVATDNGMPFADLHNLMMDVQAKAKAVLGADYLIYGGDGVHPNQSGHLVMAYAFLKAMGFDGDLGTVTVDLQGQTTATGGHEVLSSQGGVVQLQSTRYPFCFFGGPTDAGGTRSVLPFLPFNADLNRFTLVVKGLTTPQAKVTWGDQSKTFARADLEAGINLADAFLDNPFTAAFQKLDAAVAQKENWETVMIKSQISTYPWLLGQLGNDPQVAAALDTVSVDLWKRQVKWVADARAALAPVKHTITIVEQPAAG